MIHKIFSLSRMTVCLFISLFEKVLKYDKMYANKIAYCKISLLEGLLTKIRIIIKTKVSKLLFNIIF